MLCMVLTKRVTNFGQKFGNFFAQTILMEPHVLLPLYQVDGGNINRETSRFAGFMAKVEARDKSGTTNEDKV